KEDCSGSEVVETIFTSVRPRRAKLAFVGDVSWHHQKFSRHTRVARLPRTDETLIGTPAHFPATLLIVLLDRWLSGPLLRKLNRCFCCAGACCLLLFAALQAPLRHSQRQQSIQV